jgi:hypothetical protein
MKPLVNILLIACVVMLYSCATETPYDCKCDTTHLTNNDSILNDLRTDTASFNHQHRFFNVQPLEELGKEEAYRLKMSHSFSLYTQCYTFSKKGSETNIEVLQYYAARHPDSTIRIDKKYAIRLSANEWNAIKKAIDTSCFWSNEVGSGNRMVLDGGTWRLEGFDMRKRNCANREYHVDACGFEYDNQLGDLCRFLRKYAKEERLNVLK